MFPGGSLDVPAPLGAQHQPAAQECCELPRVFALNDKFCFLFIFVFLGPSAMFGQSWHQIKVCQMMFL